MQPLAFAEKQVCKWKEKSTKGSLRCWRDHLSAFRKTLTGFRVKMRAMEGGGADNERASSVFFF